MKLTGLDFASLLLRLSCSTSKCLSPRETGLPPFPRPLASTIHRPLGPPGASPHPLQRSSPFPVSFSLQIHRPSPSHCGMPHIAWARDEPPSPTEELASTSDHHPALPSGGSDTVSFQTNPELQATITALNRPSMRRTVRTKPCISDTFSCPLSGQSPMHSL